MGQIHLEIHSIFICHWSFATNTADNNADTRFLRGRGVGEGKGIED